MRNDVKTLAAMYAEGLPKSERTLAGVGWASAEDLAKRFEALLSPLCLRQVPPDRKIKLLDLGCAFGLLLDYLAENNLLDRVDYLGVDLFEETLAAARARWPGQRFEVRDVRDHPFAPATFDYCILCGVLHDRSGLSHEQMKQMAQGTLKALWPSVTKGLGFTVMSKHVDWELDHLFYWPLDDIMAFCKANLSRHAAFHIEYGLWETVALVFKDPQRQPGKVPAAWIGKTS